MSDFLKLGSGTGGSAASVSGSKFMSCTNIQHFSEVIFTAFAVQYASRPFMSISKIFGVFFVSMSLPFAFELRSPFLYLKIPPVYRV
jgi:hypothetical protein